MSDDLRDRVVGYLRAHHIMTIATTAPGRNTPHAACVFYAMDESLRLIFLSKRVSVHGTHIGEAASVAATITEDYAGWEAIRGVQLWGEVELLHAAVKAAALALYLVRFPFVRGLIDQPGLAEKMRNIGVYRITPYRAAFTDNTTGAFGREILELVAG